MVYLSLPENTMHGVLTHTPPMSNRTALGTFEGDIVSVYECSLTFRDQRDTATLGPRLAFHGSKYIRKTRKLRYLR